MLRKIIAMFELKNWNNPSGDLAFVFIYIFV